MFRQATTLQHGEWAKPWLGGALPSTCKAICLNQQTGDFKYEHSNPKFSQPQCEGDRLYLVKAIAPRGGKALATSNPRLSMAIADDTPNLQIELELKPELNHTALHQLLIHHSPITDAILANQCRKALFNNGLTTALSADDINNNGLFLQRLSDAIKGAVGFSCSNISFFEQPPPQALIVDSTTTASQTESHTADENTLPETKPLLARVIQTFTSHLLATPTAATETTITKQQLLSQIRQLQKDINSYQQQHKRFISLDEYKMLKQLSLRIDDSVKFHIDLVTPRIGHVNTVHQQLLICQNVLKSSGGGGQLTPQLYHALDALCRSVESQ